MPKPVDIRIFNIARTTLDRGACRAWLTDQQVPEDAIEKLLSSEVTDCANLVRLCGKRCYSAFVPELNPNVTRVRWDIAKYIDHILESGHGSVIEQVDYSFAIEGITRVLTSELNRHRAGVALSEGSMRFIRLTDIEYWLPTSVRPADSDTPDVAEKKEKTREILALAFKQAEDNYQALQEVWKDELATQAKFSSKKAITSLMRRTVPIGVATGGVWKFNFRALRHICTMRADEAAEEEINLLAQMLLQHMMTAEINFFGDFSINEKGFWQPKYKKV